jgi:hypothetical protein
MTCVNKSPYSPLINDKRNPYNQRTNVQDKHKQNAPVTSKEIKDHGHSDSGVEERKWVGELPPGKNIDLGRF